MVRDRGIAPTYYMLITTIISGILSGRQTGGRSHRT